eukprot:6743437-Lingulodinium_polyedra.AAC.1
MFARLRYFPRLVQHAPPQLWSMIDEVADQPWSWMQALTFDFRFLIDSLKAEHPFRRFLPVPD